MCAAILIGTFSKEAVIPLTDDVPFFQAEKTCKNQLDFICHLWDKPTSSEEPSCQRLQ